MSTRDNINIRPALPSDAIAMATIYNQAIDLGYVTADTVHVTPQSRQEVLHSITNLQNRPFWVAELEGKVMAFFYFRNFYDRPAYRITAEIGLYIDLKYTGQGYGRYFINYCLQQAPALGIEKILALIFAANQPSLRLFEQMGFEQKGELKELAKTTQGYHDLLILVKSV